MQLILLKNRIDFIIHRHYNVKSRQGDSACSVEKTSYYSAVAQW